MADIDTWLEFLRPGITYRVRSALDASRFSSDARRLVPVAVSVGSTLSILEAGVEQVPGKYGDDSYVRIVALETTLFLEYEISETEASTLFEAVGPFDLQRESEARIGRLLAEHDLAAVRASVARFDEIVRAFAGGEGLTVEAALQRLRERYGE